MFQDKIKPWSQRGVCALHEFLYPIFRNPSDFANFVGIRIERYLVFLKEENIVDFVFAPCAIARRVIVNSCQISELLRCNFIFWYSQFVIQSSLSGSPYANSLMLVGFPWYLGQRMAAACVRVVTGKCYLRMDKNIYQSSIVKLYIPVLATY